MKHGSKRARPRGRAKAKGRRFNTALVSTPRHLRTVAQFAREYDAFREPSIRWLIFKARENGLEKAGAIVRIGRRVYLDPQRFFAWVENQQPYSHLGGADNASPAMAAKSQD
jgi:hypothetical protein